MPGIVADLREMVAEQREYRELLYQLVKRDLLIRYKQSVMGFAWAVLMPLMNTAVFSVVFTRVAPIDVGMPYPLFAYTGLLAWNLSAAAWRFSIASMVSNVNLVTKVYFPREILPFAAVIVAVIDSLVGAFVLVGFMVHYGIAPTPALAFLPVVLAVQVVFTAAVALILAMANLFFRDVKYLYEVGITVWMFATSVLYPLSAAGGGYATVLRWNPMTPIIDAYRSVLIQGSIPSIGVFGPTTAGAVLLLILSWLWFHKAEFTFAENI